MHNGNKLRRKDGDDASKNSTTPESMVVNHRLANAGPWPQKPSVPAYLPQSPFQWPRRTDRPYLNGNSNTSYRQKNIFI